LLFKEIIHLVEILQTFSISLPEKDNAVIGLLKGPFQCIENGDCRLFTVSLKAKGEILTSS